MYHSDGDQSFTPAIINTVDSCDPVFAACSLIGQEGLVGFGVELDGH